MKKDEPPFSFPKTLEEFEYAFNEDGQLRHTETGEPFVFNAREDLHRWNQKRYEALGEIITLYVYELLEKTCNMTKAILPVDASPDEPTSFIYLTPDALLNPSKLLVLIQGSGVERAGQWARRLIINQDLDSGTQIPFITRAIQARVDVVMMYGWSVLPLLKGDWAESGGGIMPSKLRWTLPTARSRVRTRLCQQAEVVEAVLFFPSHVSVHLSGTPRPPRLRTP
uniref:ARB2 cotranscriptional regulator A n=1 Tax=Takifugu rubripes TaxID=31033 RepID=A0A3B5JUC7_TAKRU